MTKASARGCATVTARTRPRRNIRRPPSARADVALRQSRLDRDLAARRSSRRPPVRARAARRLGRRNGDRLRNRPRRAGARDPAHDRRARERSRCSRDRAGQPGAARRARRPTGPPSPRAGAVPRRQAARARGRVSGVGRPARPSAGRPRSDRARLPRGGHRQWARARDRADGRLGRGGRRGARDRRSLPRRPGDHGGPSVPSRSWPLCSTRPALRRSSSGPAPTTPTRGPHSCDSQNDSRARSGRSRSAPGPDSRRITRSSPAICPPTARGYARSLAPYDLVLAIGAPVFRQYPYQPGPLVEAGTRVAMVSQDPAEVHRSPVELAVLAPPGSCLRRARPIVTVREGRPTPFCSAAPPHLCRPPPANRSGPGTSSPRSPIASRATQS